MREAWEAPLAGDSQTLLAGSSWTGSFVTALSGYTRARLTGSFVSRRPGCFFRKLRTFHGVRRRAHDRRGMGLMHVAGPVETDELEGLVQRCLRCDQILVDADGMRADGELRVGRRVPDEHGDCPGALDRMPTTAAG